MKVFADCPPCGDILDGFPCASLNTYRLQTTCQNTCPCTPTGPFGNSFDAWWPLDETIGTTANDWQNNADGIWVGPVNHFTSGKVDGAFTFNGTGANVSVSSNPTVPQGVTDFSVDAWVRWEFHNSNHEPIVWQNGYYLFLDNVVASAMSPKKLVLYLANLNQRCESDDHIVPKEQWVHVAATLQQNTFDGCKLFVNGQLVKESTPMAANDLGVPPLYIGRNGSFYFKGAIDEVELFNRALSLAEINSIYLAGSAGKCKPFFPICEDQPNGTVGCGSLTDHDCDNPDTCLNDVCVSNLAPNGTACGSGANTACDNPDACQSGVCLSNYEPTGTSCSGGPSCDDPNTCDGQGNCTCQVPVVSAPSMIAMAVLVCAVGLFIRAFRKRQRLIPRAP